MEKIKKGVEGSCIGVIISMDKERSKTWRGWGVGSKWPAQSIGALAETANGDSGGTWSSEPGRWAWHLRRACLKSASPKCNTIPV